MGKLLRRLCRRDRTPKAEAAQPARRPRRDPHEPLRYDNPAQHYTPIQRWLYGPDEPERPRRDHKEAGTTDYD